MIREISELAYHKIIYPYLTAGEAEENRNIAHQRALGLMQIVENNTLLQKFIHHFFTYQDHSLESRVMGLKFTDPLGLAAGFDKNGEIPNALAALFSHYTEGTILPKPQQNPEECTIFYLPADLAYINRMGLPTDGVDIISKRLARKNLNPNSIRGGSIGPNSTSLEKGVDAVIDDYIQTAKKLAWQVDYLEISPTSPTVRKYLNLFKKPILEDLITETGKIATKAHLPLTIKLSSDHTRKEIVEILATIDGKVDAITIANTSTSDEIRNQLTSRYRDEAGGISGKPLTQRVLELSHFVYEETAGNLPIIRSGGVMYPKDYWEAITYGGASLVEIYSALVAKPTSSPTLPYRWNRTLANMLKHHHLHNVQEAVGICS